MILFSSLYGIYRYVFITVVHFVSIGVHYPCGTVLFVSWFGLILHQQMCKHALHVQQKGSVMKLYEQWN